MKTLMLITVFISALTAASTASAVKADKNGCGCTDTQCHQKKSGL